MKYSHDLQCAGSLRNLVIHDLRESGINFDELSCPDPVQRVPLKLKKSKSREDSLVYTFFFINNINYRPVVCLLFYIIVFYGLRT